MKNIDPNKCPLCQANNGCMANSSTPCWCNEAKITKALLKEVPSSFKNKACICQSCIEKFNFDLAKSVTK